MTPPKGRIHIPEIDAFWDEVDEMFSGAMISGRVPTATVIASALQAACFAAMVTDCDEALFLEMALKAWEKCSLDVRTAYAREEAAQGKAAKA